MFLHAWKLGVLSFFSQSPWIRWQRFGSSGCFTLPCTAALPTEMR